MGVPDVRDEVASTGSSCFRYTCTCVCRSKHTYEHHTDVCLPDKPSGAASYHCLALLGGYIFNYGGLTATKFGTDAFGATSALEAAAGAASSDALLVRRLPAFLAMPGGPHGNVMGLTRVYDGDTLNIPGDADLHFSVNLCSNAILPCSLVMKGGGTIRLHTDAGILCDSTRGCTGVHFKNLVLHCAEKASVLGPLQISGAGAFLQIESSTISRCSSIEDGGSARVYNGATVKIYESTFQRSSSKVHIYVCI